MRQIRHLEIVIGTVVLCAISVLFVISRIFTEIVFATFVLLVGVYLIRSYTLLVLSQKEEAPLPDVAPEALPTMAILIPVHNEERVIAMTLRRLILMDYPPDRLELQFVLDACSDKSVEVLETTLSECDYRLDETEMLGSPIVSSIRVYRSGSGPSVRLFIRDLEIGGRGKAAALNAAIVSTNAEIIGFYDADHRPIPGNAHRAAQNFAVDPRIGCVQGPCYILNGYRNILTSCIFFESISLNRVEQPAKGHYRGMVCFEGANGYFRRAAIEDGGGFDAGNLAEDTYLSFRLVEAGYRIVFDTGIRSYEQCPENLHDWYHQRLRWARGWFQCTGELFGKVGRLNTVQKLEGEFLLLGGVQSILMMCFLLVFPLTQVYLIGAYLFGFTQESVIVEGLSTFGLLAPILPFLYGLAITTPLTMGIMGAALFSRDDASAMRLNLTNVWALFLFPVYSFMTGLVALFAFINQFVLRRPATWVKTPRAADEFAG